MMKASSGPASTRTVPAASVPGKSADCRSVIGSSEELAGRAPTCMVAAPGRGATAVSWSVASGSRLPRASNGRG